MQPNDQQGYYTPDQNQPTQPATPQQSVAVPASTSAQAPQAIGATAVQETITTPLDVEEPGYSQDDVTWTAHEFVHQEKGKGWFLIFAFVMIALFGAAVLLQQWTFAVLVVVIAVVIIVSSRRPPRELTYAITDEGLVIDNVLHDFDKFKAFSVIHDGDAYFIMLIPTQRFQPGVTVYFPEESGEAIVDALGARLPMKDRKLDMVDRLVRLLRL